MSRLWIFSFSTFAHELFLSSFLGISIWIAKDSLIGSINMIIESQLTKPEPDVSILLT
ncbi:hypothetical protein RchiOBHm_Chr1g0363351 [Rosa chinensis]|uniref:Uncharacterized protein n=1 Tax=Rosa chinensis TaxID=74649 RepID=A0A2P6SJF8_ROSCH|nr:hypothetical protein RchiOBHm_Chr1g0363351 [Rosa chinensis]